MKKKNMFGPEPIRQERDRCKKAFALAMILFAAYSILVVLYAFHLVSRVETLKRQVAEQNIRAHSALNDRDSFADQLKTCQAK